MQDFSQIPSVQKVMALSAASAATSAALGAARGSKRQSEEAALEGTVRRLQARTDQMEESAAEMEKRFLVKVIGQLGGDETDLKEIRVLNRVLRWTPDGILYEADP